MKDAQVQLIQFHCMKDVFTYVSAQKLQKRT